jgi:hypothetical protein
MDKQSKWKWASGKARNWNKRLAFFDGASKRNKEIPLEEKVFWSVSKFSWILVITGILIAVIWWMAW